jgi:hypothetical protein
MRVRVRARREMRVARREPLHPVLRIKPTTIAAALVYLCESRMLDTFRHLGTLDGKTRERKIQEIGRTFGLGIVEGKDGVVRVKVDMDPFVP